LKSLLTINALIKRLSLLALCVLSLATLQGQSRSELEDKRRNLLKEIERTSKLLDQTKQNKAATLERFIALQNQINAREKLIETLETELQYVENRISRTIDVISSLEADIDALQQEYGDLLRMAYRQKMNKSNLFFLFSSRSFNEAFQRWQYIKQFEEYRKKQAVLIMKTQETLARKISHLEEQRLEKEDLLLTQEEQKRLLLKEFQSKDKILQSLKSDETRLVKELQKQREAHERLNEAIERIIREEVAKNRREARRTEGSSSESLPSSPEVSRLSNAFSDNRGKLPWPIDKGIISRRFGKQEHPSIPSLTITNNGIDFLTEPEARVKAVFRGTVVGKQFIPGYDYTLIVQHGNFYTVYSHLEELFVDRGSTVETGMLLGIAKLDEKVKRAKVHFEVWHNKVRQNPETWLSR
jgi:septal ring factor EnvC (AmiA/AmiB activator)